MVLRRGRDPRGERVEVALQGSFAARGLDMKDRPEAPEYPMIMLSSLDHLIKRGQELLQRDSKATSPAVPHPGLIDERLANIEENPRG